MNWILKIYLVNIEIHSNESKIQYKHIHNYTIVCTVFFVTALCNWKPRCVDPVFHTHFFYFDPTETFRGWPLFGRSVNYSFPFVSQFYNRRHNMLQWTLKNNKTPGPFWRWVFWHSNAVSGQGCTAHIRISVKENCDRKFFGSNSC